jgi:hypothetical protein
MWQYFSSKYKVLQLKKDKALELAKISGKTSGAFIEEFCRTYLNLREMALLKKKGYSCFLDALRAKQRIPEKELRETINFNSLKKDLECCMADKPSNEQRPIGFIPA